MKKQLITFLESVNKMKIRITRDELSKSKGRLDLTSQVKSVELDDKAIKSIEEHVITSILRVQEVNIDESDSND